MADSIEKIDVFVANLDLGETYLGSLGDGEEVNSAGYFVRKTNSTVYVDKNRSLVVKITTKDGVIGWGETYGLVAPKAVAELINDLLVNFLVGRDPFDVSAIYDQLYDLMRVRAYIGGFYLDALAAIDIAIHDIMGKSLGLPVHKLLGGKKHNQIHAYISGLPKDHIEERVEMAQNWQSKGFDAVKFHLPAAREGAHSEFKALRDGLGDNFKIAGDLHWSQTPASFIKLAKDVEPYRPWFLEAPLPTENFDGLAKIANESNETIAVGEEWRSVFDAKLRIDNKAVDIIQPEMGHTGITQFMKIGQYAEAHHLEIIPHATIGSGIFLAASLQASAALRNVVSHEYQHSILDSLSFMISDAITCKNGSYSILEKPGIGVEPSADMIKRMTLVK